MRNRFFRWVRRHGRPGAILMAGLIVATQVQAGSTTLENAGPNSTDASEQEVEEPLWFENPGPLSRGRNVTRNRRIIFFSSPASTGR